jgi:hypothetical protein
MLMMSKEIPLQHDMFTDELVDNRTPTQKHRDVQRAQPQQLEMFSPQEVAQFGVQANPTLPITPRTRLELWAQDTRTDEEREQDLQREAQKKTYPMFDRPPGEDERVGDLAEPPRIFEGHPDRSVTIDGEPLPITETAERHSPDGWNWGYGGSGPAALAHAILACVADETTADACYQFFKRDVVADWEMGHPWQMTDQEVLA